MYHLLYYLFHYSYYWPAPRFGAASVARKRGDGTTAGWLWMASNVSAEETAFITTPVGLVRAGDGGLLSVIAALVALSVAGCLVIAMHLSCIPPAA